MYLPAFLVFLMRCSLFFARCACSPRIGASSSLPTAGFDLRALLSEPLTAQCVGVVLRLLNQFLFSDNAASAAAVSAALADIG